MIVGKANPDKHETRFLNLGINIRNDKGINVFILQVVQNP